MDLYQRVDEAIARGEAWRAKEILRGNIASGSYDSQLYERYGLLLMDLGELVEAGKYLFLSGRRSPEFARAIEVYLSRHPADRPDVLYHSFPSATRFGEQLSRYPLEVRRTLQERGLPEYFEELHRQRLERHRRRKGNFETRTGRRFSVRVGLALAASGVTTASQAIHPPQSGSSAARRGPGGRCQPLPHGRDDSRRRVDRPLGSVAGVTATKPALFTVRRPLP